jgi:low temperature requirement protein LtrA
VTLLRPPTLRVLDAAQSRKVTWLELFFDLVFVAAVAQVGAPLSDGYTPGGLARFGFLFLLIWWAWSGHTTYSTRFEGDDVLQRALTCAQMFAVAVMAVNAGDALGSRSSAGFAAAYAAMRLVLVAQYLRVRHIPESRGLTTSHAAGFGAAAACWLASALVEPPARFWLWGVALTIDLATPLLTAHLTVRLPPDASHLPERFGLFTIILIGESMVAVMKGMESQETWTPAAAVSALLGMAFAFLIWWWYFEGSGAAAERSVRTRAQAAAFVAWTYAHLPLYLGIAVAGVGMEHVITVADRSHLHAAEAWILCLAVATVMTALAVIAATGDGAQTDAAPRARLLRDVAFAALAVPAAVAGPHVAPATLVGLLTALCLAPVLASAAARRAGTHGPARHGDSRAAERAA